MIDGTVNLRTSHESYVELLLYNKQVFERKFNFPKYSTKLVHCTTFRFILEYSRYNTGYR